MQNKGFIRVFAVLLTLVCLFYLGFTAATQYHTGKAEEYAQGDSIKLKNYLDSIATENVYLGYTFKEAREMEIGLGLDLKGGMNVTLQLSVGEVLKSLSDNNENPDFNKALSAASAGSNGATNFVDAFYEEYQKIDPNVKLATIFATFNLKEKINSGSTNEEVIKVLKEEVDGAVDNSFIVLRTRIDRFGVVAPNIQRLEQTGRILVELPGVKDPKRVESLLKGSANLEFWETYNFEEVAQGFVAANQTLMAIESKDTTTVDSLGMQEGPLFSRLTFGGGGATVGTASERDTAAINKYLAMQEVRELLPSNAEFKWAVKGDEANDMKFQLYALKAINGGASLAGEVVADARDDFDQQNQSQSVVSMSMTSDGSDQWAVLTKNNIGRCVAIVLDGQVYSAPVVNTEIKGGDSQITGNFTPEEAKDLANVLKSGKMAASVQIVQKDVIGPSLGQEAIESGMWSFVVALIVLMIYMISVYGVAPGLIANFGLICNMFFTMGILASFHAVLTLSGIAGLVLTLGIAVDANVLIYERAKEELRGGKKLRAAVSDAYKNAFSAIFDSNLTSVITGIILFAFGTGPIKGFATTLMIGIIISFFTAVFLTRLIYETGLEKGWFKNLTFSSGLSKKMMFTKVFDFIGQRKTGYIVAAVAVVICCASFGVRGLSKGIDFSGGRNYVIQLDKPAKTSDIAKILRPQFDDASLSVITIGGENQIRVSTNYGIDAENGEMMDSIITDKLYAGLKGTLDNVSKEEFATEGGNYIKSVQKVGPSIADDITRGAIWSVALSLLAIALYILIRFRDIAFSVATLVSLAFDTVIIIGFYSLFYGVLPFSMEIDQSFIAAILTIIGYSVNDKVVVFDRIREFTQLYPKHDKKSLLNNAINSTLTRTINTSISTAIVLICIFVLGGDTIRSFTFAMLLGVIVGTLSSIYMAVPVAYQVMQKNLAKKSAKK